MEISCICLARQTDSSERIGWVSEWLFQVREPWDQQSGEKVLNQYKNKPTSQIMLSSILSNIKTNKTLYPMFSIIQA